MKKSSMLNNLNWKILLIRLLVNTIAIILVAILMPNIYFVQISLINVLIIGLTLGILNALLKPILMLLTAQLFFATFGLLVILINALILYLLARFFPQILVVHGLLWALIGGAVLGLVSNALENLLGVYPPIVPDQETELRRQIEEKSVSPMQNLIGSKSPRLSPSVDTQSLEEIRAAQATLDVIGKQASSAESTGDEKQPAGEGSEPDEATHSPSTPQPTQDSHKASSDETIPPDAGDNHGGAA